MRHWLVLVVFCLGVSALQTTGKVTIWDDKAFTHAPVIFMNPGAAFHKLFKLFSPGIWLAVSVLSLVIASAAGALVLSRQGVQAQDVLLPAYDWARRFARDTVRLTFKTDKGVQETVFVAPRGILDQSTPLKLVEKFDDFVPDVEAANRPPLAPLRVLDPEWTPVFSGKKEDVDA